MTATETTVAGRYRIGALIGRGGMAEVYRGFDPLLDREVAIKLLDERLSGDPDFRTRFRQEAQSAARMTHPTIVKVYDAGEETEHRDDGELIRPYIVMEYVDGRLLSDVIEGGPIPEPDAARIIAGVLTALEYSHDAGVVHRDIKPANIMLTRDGDVKVVDFGIARAASERAGNVAETTAVLGTARYFSPEQAQGRPVDARSDLYAAGVVLYEMLTGVPPFVGVTPVAVAYQHVRERPEDPRHLVQGITPAMSAVVMRALEKDPAARFPTAAAFRGAVETAAAGIAPPAAGGPPPIDTGRFSELLSGDDASLAVRSLAAPQLEAAPTQKGPPVGWLWAGILLIAIILGSLGYWLVTLQAPAVDAQSVEMPSLVGSTAKEARQQLQQLGLQVETVREPDADAAAGTVIDTTPDAGFMVALGDSVTLTVSSGVPQARVPEVSGLTLGQAKKQLRQAGFKIGAITETQDPSIAAGVVAGTKPRAEKLADIGVRVEILISNGMVTLPNLVGESLSDATRTLNALELSFTAAADRDCESSVGDPVASQSVPPGSVEQHTSLEITYCVG